MSSLKVLLVGPGLSGGGAEGRFTNIAKYLFNGQSTVAVLTLAQHGELLLSNQVIDLGWRGRLSYPKLVWRLARKLRVQRYDAVLAFGLFPILVAIVAVICSGRDTKLIINEITRPEMTSKTGRGKAYNFLRRILYGKSTLITANSIDGLRETCKLAGVAVEKGVRVVNVIDGSGIREKAKDTPSVTIPQGSYVVCVARLQFMKRIDTVIDALSLLTNKTDCKLVIIGEGEARSALELQVYRLGLQDRVQFTGSLKNPFPVLIQATAFVLASEYEGFSNSVLEAMFCDVPVITSFCSSDARQMCNRRAALGFEVGDHRQLAEHISALFENKELVDELTKCASEYRTPHALENAIPFYEDLVRTVVQSEVRDR